MKRGIVLDFTFSWYWGQRWGRKNQYSPSDSSTTSLPLLDRTNLAPPASLYKGEDLWPQVSEPAATQQLSSSPAYQLFTSTSLEVRFSHQCTTTITSVAITYSILLLSRQVYCCYHTKHIVAITSSILWYTVAITYGILWLSHPIHCCYRVYNTFAITTLGCLLYH